MEKTDIAIIGAGPGGYVAAIRAAQLGKQVTLIEEKALGGICLQEGCIPSKALISAADFYHRIQKAGDMGITIQNASLDFEKLQSWKQSILTKLTQGVESLCKSNKITLIKGTATFSSSHTLTIKTNEGNKELAFGHAIIATGSRPIQLPQFPFDEKTIISSTGALSMQNIPKTLAVIGGGYIGLELGTVYAKLGSKVTVIEMTDQLLPGNDKDCVDIIGRNFSKLGVQVLLESKATSFTNNTLCIETREGQKKIEADIVLVAVGRIPNTKHINLENTKVTLDSHGFIEVNDSLQTKDPNIYAIGDISRGPMLAHKASYQGKAVAEIIAKKRESLQDELVPAVIFTDPEIASIGLTELQAQQQNIPVSIGKFPFTALGKAMIKNETQGFVKIISDENKQKILGVQIVGCDASNLISEAALAIKHNLSVDEISELIHPHPTLSESLGEAAEAVQSRAIHILNPKTL